MSADEIKDIGIRTFGVVAITSVAIMQVVAWACGHNGTVFALTSAVIGGITGSIFGFSYKKQKE